VDVAVCVAVGEAVEVEVGVMLPVGVDGRKVEGGVDVNVGGVPLVVGVGVNVEVGVGVEVAVIVPVDVEVGVAVDGTARLRKTTIVCEEAVPSTIVTVALPSLRFLLIRRPAGIV